MKYALINKERNSLNIKDILLNRGIEKDMVPYYLNPDRQAINDYSSLGLDDLQHCWEQIKRAAEANLKTVIIVDSDADGFCSSAMLMNYLHHYYPQWVEGNIATYLHSDKQHGLEDCMEWILDRDPQLVIVPDAGSNDYEQHKILYDKGMKICVLDHHEAPKKSEWAITINNQLSPYPNKQLCGGGIVWQFLRYVNDFEKKDGYCYEFMDLVALANISDMMSQVNIETSFLIREGIKPEYLKNPFVKEMAKYNAFSIGDPPTPIGWAFYITPFINSMNRSGTKAEKFLLFRSMLEYEAYKEIPSGKRGHKGEMTAQVLEAVRIAVNVKNRQTKAQDVGMQLLENKIAKEGLMDNKVLTFFLEPDEIEKNLAGLAGNKIMSKYQRPVVVLTKSKDPNDGKIYYKGSARGCPLAGVKDFRADCESLEGVQYAQGHASAFGLSIEEHWVDEFIKKTNELYSDIRSEPTYDVDAVINATDIIPPIAQAVLNIGQYATLWGQGVPEPLVVIENVRIPKKDIIFYRKNTTTMKIDLPCGISAIRFNVTDDFEQELNEFEDNETVVMDIIGTCSVNSYMGRVTPQIKVTDINLSYATKPQTFYGFEF